MAWLRSSGVRFATLLLAGFIPLGFNAPSRVPVSQAPRVTTMKIGMYNTGTPWGFTTLSTFESQLRLHMDIVHWYQAWGAADVNASAFDVSLFNATVTHGSTPFITWEPWDETLPTNQTTFPLKSIAAGRFDTYIDSWATGLKNFGQPVMLTFAQEMQGDWYPWGYGVNGNTAADYVNAYRHIHDRFTRAGATNVKWVWTPDADDTDSGYPASTLFYPGDTYTDWLGVDAYNFGTTMAWSAWRSLSDVLALSYQRLAGLSATKPLVLAEWASAESGGDKASWLLDTVKELQGSFPRVRAAVWFNERKTQWALDSSTTSLTAAGQAFRSLDTVTSRRSP